MSHIELSKDQENIINVPFGSLLFIEGPAGCGKTTVGVNRLRKMLNEGIPADEVIVLVPQRTTSLPYLKITRDPSLSAGGLVDILTLTGLAQRMTSLFWPLLLNLGIFERQDQPPTFLNMETAQYYLARLLDPLIENEGYFESITIDRNRLYSQILDNLNKAAFNGFDINSIGDRLKNAWVGDSAQIRVYDDVQDCMKRFREYCQRHNLLDFSLTNEVFSKYLWNCDECRTYLSLRYRHLIYDNIEEDIPVTHDIVFEWLGDVDSGLLIYDENGGYRSFLGADIDSAYKLSAKCEEKFLLTHSYVTPVPLIHFGESFSNVIYRQPIEKDLDNFSFFVDLSFHSYIPEMVEWICEQISALLEVTGNSPGEIVILAPFLTDSLRFSLMNRLSLLNIPVRSHRPSRSLSDEPATRCLFTLAKLAHPQWKIACSTEDLRNMLMLSIGNIDLVRADLLSRIVFHESNKVVQMSTFEKIQPDMQDRITFVVGERYEVLRRWIENYRLMDTVELDIFFTKVFSELLSHPGYGFFENYDAATITSRLVNSVKYFRRVIGNTCFDEELSEYLYLHHQFPTADIGPEYIKMVEGGVLASQFFEYERGLEENAVLISPAYSYLVTNRPVQYQFWLDIGNMGWWQRLYQPLTHPHVLSRQWDEKNKWTNADEIIANQFSLARLVKGLIARCRKKIFLCAVGINEQGIEERSPLLLNIQTLVRMKMREDKHV